MRLLLLSLALVGYASAKAIDKRESAAGVQCGASLQCDSRGCKRWCPGPDGKGQWMEAVPEKRESDQISVESSNTAESSHVIEKRDPLESGPFCKSKDGEYKMCSVRQNTFGGPYAIDRWGACRKDEAICNASTDSQPWADYGKKKREADQISVESSNTAESSHVIEKRDPLESGPFCKSKDGEYKMCSVRQNTFGGPYAIDRWGACRKDEAICNASTDSQPWADYGKKKRESDQISVESSNTAESSHVIEKRRNSGPYCKSKDGQYKMCTMRCQMETGPCALDTWGSCRKDEENCNASTASRPYGA